MNFKEEDMKKNMYEIFNEFDKATTKEERKGVLLRNKSYELRSVLQGAFNPNIQFVFDKIPEYNRIDIPPGMGYNVIGYLLNKSYLFTLNDPRVAPELTLEKKKTIFLQLIETLEEKEAQVFCNMLLKDLKVKFLTYNLVKETFPDLLPVDGLQTTF
ncbi:MAG: hypothetical protein WD512_19605 [Candidatus Paceibacterota bacterium]